MTVPAPVTTPDRGARPKGVRGSLRSVDRPADRRKQMSGVAMAVIAVVAVLLPIILMVAFNRDNVADSRGRRVFHRWHT